MLWAVRAKCSDWDGKVWTILVGRFQTEEEAQAVAKANARGEGHPEGLEYYYVVAEVPYVHRAT